MSAQQHSCNKPDCYFCYYMGIKEPDYSRAIYNFTPIKKRKKTNRSKWLTYEIKAILSSKNIKWDFECGMFPGRTIHAVYTKRHHIKKFNYI